MADKDAVELDLNDLIKVRGPHGGAIQGNVEDYNEDRVAIYHGDKLLWFPIEDIIEVGD